MSATGSSDPSLLVGVGSRWQGRRVLVTGGTGFIGSRVVALGRAIGAEVHVTTTNYSKSNLENRWLVDITDKKKVFELVRQIQPEGVIHLAAAGVAYSSASFDDLLRVNVLGLDNLLSAVTAHVPACPVVIAGSGFEYASKSDLLKEDDSLLPGSKHGISKATASMLALSYSTDLRITILRLFSVFGPGEREPRLVPSIINRALRGEPVDVTAGAQLRDYTFVDDAAFAFWLGLLRSATELDPVILNIGSGRVLALKEFIESIAAELRHVGVDVTLRLGALSYRQDEIMIYTPRIDRMRKVLGWCPTTSLSDAIRATIQALTAV